MLEICPKCGNHDWDKEVDGTTIICPQCGEKWSFTKKPLYILTGCSGIGKTTTARVLQSLTTDFIILDSDMFYNIMPHETEEDSYDQVEQIESLSKDIMQCGKSVIWTMAGNIDKLLNTYNARFFSEIYVLALVCDENSLRARMKDGRGITDENWIKGSLDYNHFFKTHSQIGEVKFETLDTEGKSIDEVAELVLQWMKEH